MGVKQKVANIHVSSKILTDRKRHYHAAFSGARTIVSGAHAISKGGKMAAHMTLSQVIN